MEVCTFWPPSPSSLVSPPPLRQPPICSLYLFTHTQANFKGYVILVESMFSVQFSRSVVSDSLRPHGLQHARPPCPSPTPGVYPNSCPLAMPSSHLILFSSCLQSFLASGSFQISQFFASNGQSIGVPASTSVLPMNTQDCSPLEWTGWVSLESKGLSRVFSERLFYMLFVLKCEKSVYLSNQIANLLL